MASAPRARFVSPRARPRRTRSSPMRSGGSSAARRPNPVPREWTRESLAAGVRSADRRALARAITLVENSEPLAYELVRDLYRDTGRAYAVGVTGPPGGGKSSLISALVRHIRGLGRTVGVISPARCSPSPRRGRKPTSSRPSPTIPSCDGFSTRSSAVSSTRSRRFRRSFRRCSALATRTAPTLADFEEARRRLDGVARVTPVYSSETLSNLTGRQVWLKDENLQ